jgi:hypothetical protein
MAGLAGILACASGVLADQPAASSAGANALPNSMPQDGFFSSITQSVKQGDQEVVRGHFDLGSPPKVRRYYCLVDPNSGALEPNGVLGDPISRADGMTGLKSSAVSLYRCANAEQQGILVTDGYVLSGRAALGVAPAQRAQPPRAPAVQAAVGGRLRKEQLIGAWRLVSMDYRGPDNASVDPFYQPDSTGLIIYDPSGWMSVHIAGPHRQAWKVPPSRLATPGSPEDSALKVAAFDTYYAYFGTWDLDEAQSVVTHHVLSALLPGEDGQNYGQQVALENGRLIFTTRSGPEGEQTVRHKIWERLTR